MGSLREIVLLVLGIFFSITTTASGTPVREAEALPPGWEAQIIPIFEVGNPYHTKRTDWVITLPDSYLETYRYDPRNCAMYTDAVNRIQAINPDLSVYCMLVPLPVEFEDSYSDRTDPQKLAIQNVYDSLDSRIGRVDALSELGKGYKAGQYVYFKTDHHWTPLGAYHATTAFAKTAGFAILPLTNYTVVNREPFLGYLYAMAPDQEVRKRPDLLFNYSRIAGSEWIRIFDSTGGFLKLGSMYDLSFQNYSMFLGGDMPLIVAEGEKQNDRVLIVIKDSYGNAIIPLLTPYFEKVIAVDPRVYVGDLQELIFMHKATDLLILDYTKVMMSHTYPAYLTDISERQSKTNAGIPDMFRLDAHKVYAHGTGRVIGLLKIDGEQYIAASDAEWLLFGTELLYESSIGYREGTIVSGGLQAGGMGTDDYIEIEGEPYVKLMDVCGHFGISVQWDAASETFLLAKART